MVPIPSLWCQRLAAVSHRSVVARWHALAELGASQRPGDPEIGSRLLALLLEKGIELRCLQGEETEACQNLLLPEPVHIHSHGGRAALVETGELRPTVAFLGVSACDEYGNANGISGESRCGSLGYALVDAEHAETVILVTEQIVPFPHTPAVIRQDRVDFIVKVDSVGDPSRINVGATRITSNPRELLIARHAADVIEHSGYFRDGFSLQTGSGASSTAAIRFLEPRLRRHGVTAGFALGGVTAGIVDLHQAGLIDKIIDVQSFDVVAGRSLADNPHHMEISADQYASPLGKGTQVRGMIAEADERVVREGLLAHGDLIVVVAGSPGGRGGTNPSCALAIAEASLAPIQIGR